ncbi:putative ankyrin repeat protein R848 [Diplonema papillatum]|nr:putative ankyrin repeat protein R848 [Diplonema papillatum]|eukprot:gene17748-27323_t
MADDAAARPIDRELFEASRRGNTEAVRRLLAEGASPLGYHDYAGRGGAMMAAERGHLPALKLLVDWGSGAAGLLSAVSQDGEGCLSMSSSNGHASTVSYLLGRGRFAPEDLVLPLSLASYHGHLPVVRLLVQHGAPLQAADEDGMTPVDNAKLFGQHPKQTRLPRHDDTLAFLQEKLRTRSKL